MKMKHTEQNTIKMMAPEFAFFDIFCSFFRRVNGERDTQL